jgi:hypothetical protein
MRRTEGDSRRRTGATVPGASGQARVRQRQGLPVCGWAVGAGGQGAGPAASAGSRWSGITAGAGGRVGRPAAAASVRPSPALMLTVTRMS